MTAVEAEAFELSDSDIAAMGAADTAPLRCKAAGCMEPIVKPARGRTPEYCPKHKGGRTTGNKGASGKTWNRAQEIETHLTETVVTLGNVLGMFNEFDGMVIATKMPKVVHELVELAKDDKNLQRYLIFIASPGKYGPLILATGGVLGPIAMNHNMHKMLPWFREEEETIEGEGVN